MKTFFKKHYRKILCVLLAVVFLVSGAFLLNELLSGKSTGRSLEKYTLPADQTGGLPENPIDFDALLAVNADVCGWIRVPGTKIDYPVLRPSNGNDSYYLRRNIYGKSETAGSIYIESVNSASFSDPNTVIYGHNMRNGTMFRDLQNFKNRAYFNEHPTIYLYTPGRRLTYTIFACHRYDNRHLMKSFDFDDPAVFAAFLDECVHSDSPVHNTRDVPVSADDRVVTLSTCIDSRHKYRLLVQGVLVEDTATRPAANTGSVS